MKSKGNLNCPSFGLSFNHEIAHLSEQNVPESYQGDLEYFLQIMQ
jgi:hypothetical protein